MKTNIEIKDKKQVMKSWMKRYGLLALGLILGAVGGYLYWRYVGCASGTCPITASPWTSTVWGAAIGGLLMSSFKKEKSYEYTTDDLGGESGCASAGLL